MQRSRASPPLGTIPSAAALLVVLIASSNASFFYFISDFEGAPTRRDSYPAGKLC